MLYSPLKNFNYTNYPGDNGLYVDLFDNAECKGITYKWHHTQQKPIIFKGLLMLNKRVCC